MFQTKKLESQEVGGIYQDKYVALNKDRNMTKDEVIKIYKKFNDSVKRKNKDGQVLIRCLTIFGWRTYKGFSQDELNLEDEEDYLKNNGVKNVNKFVKDFYQMQIVIKY